MEAEQKQEKGNALSIPLSIIVAGALIAGAVYFGGKASVQNTAAVGGTDVKTVIAIDPVTAEDHILGDPHAPITIVEYSDLECPFCKVFHSTLHKVIDTYGKDGKVAWVYRHFPLAGLHSKAPHEAEASECAAELGGNVGFWNYMDKLMSVTPSNNGLDESQLPIIAEQVGLNKKAFETCLASGKYKDKIQKNFDEAVANGGRGTPFSIIVTKNEKIPVSEGALPYENLKTLIDELLAK